MGNTNSVIEQNALLPPTDCLGNNVEKPTFPQHAVYSERMKSFETWPEASPVRKTDLVEAGLIYIGVGDSCRCYHCGGGLKGWLPGHIPMREHAKLYPTCPHVLLVKGQAYIDAVSNGEMAEDNASQNGAANYLERPACLSCIQNGYPREMVLKAVEAFISRNEHSDFKAAEICAILFELEENPDYEIPDSVETDREAPDPTPGKNAALTDLMY